MKERWREPMAMVRIRRGGATDAPFIREVAVDVFGYNSKVYYVVTQGAGLGDGAAQPNPDDL